MTRIGYIVIEIFIFLKGVVVRGDDRLTVHTLIHSYLTLLLTILTTYKFYKRINAGSAGSEPRRRCMMVGGAGESKQRHDDMILMRERAERARATTTERGRTGRPSSERSVLAVFKYFCNFI